MKSVCGKHNTDWFGGIEWVWAVKFDLPFREWHFKRVRIMGLDVGSRTIGVALSDESASVAGGLLTLKRKGTAADVKALQALIRDHAVEKVVVGLPVEMSGRIGHRARRVLVLIRALEEKWTGPIETWDERLSTVAAERTLIQADLGRGQRRKVIDKVAATLILQTYLDAQQPSPRFENP
jgi:putative Holliday junction resolvase